MLWVKLSLKKAHYPLIQRYDMLKTQIKITEQY